MADLTTTGDKRRAKKRATSRKQEIAEDLLARIESGEFPPGSYLPTKKQLMAHYKVSLVTLDNALRVLKDPPLSRILPQQGRGTLVLTPPPVRVAGHDSDDDLLSELAQQLQTGIAALSGAVRKLTERVDALEARDAERESAGSQSGS